MADDPVTRGEWHRVSLLVIRAKSRLTVAEAQIHLFQTYGVEVRPIVPLREAIGLALEAQAILERLEKPPCAR